jgi:predicted DNA-binding protein with PD1-like motif
MHYTFTPGPTHLFRLAAGADIAGGLLDFATANGIEAAWVSYLGAVRRATFRYYDQEALEYRDLVMDQHLEVLIGTGNISMLDGAPFLHSHAVFGDDRGAAFGGHIAPGCEVFSLEVRMEVLEGDPPVRRFDAATGLGLWS